MKEDVFQTAIFLKKNIDRYRQTLQELEKMNVFVLHLTQ